MWPKFSAILGDDKYRIRCKNRYTIHYESGLIILLYRYSLPRHLHPDMEKIFGIRKSHLSAIIQSFSEALYQISIPYMTDPTIWHHRMPYYSQLISNKTRGIANNICSFIDGTIRKTCRPIYHQRLVYTRFKKCHGLKFQSMLILLEDVVATQQTDRRTCPLGVCSYVLETLDVVNLARN